MSIVIGTGVFFQQCALGGAAIPVFYERLLQLHYSLFRRFYSVAAPHNYRRADFKIFYVITE
jgi:hypothetical protein